MVVFPVAAASRYLTCGVSYSRTSYQVCPLQRVLRRVLSLLLHRSVVMVRLVLVGKRLWRDLSSNRSKLSPWRPLCAFDVCMDLSRNEMSECDFCIHAVVDDVAVGFYVEASSHTEASNEAMSEAQRRFPGKSLEIRVVEKLRSSNSV